jgi:putative transposase
VSGGNVTAKVDRFYPSSKTCSVCGFDREWICPDCGNKHDRDINAAMNILLEGERIIGVRSTKFTLVENPTVDDRCITS